MYQISAQQNYLLVIFQNDVDSLHTHPFPVGNLGNLCKIQ